MRNTGYASLIFRNNSRVRREIFYEYIIYRTFAWSVTPTIEIYKA
jgi:hypothetical protein